MSNLSMTNSFISLKLSICQKRNKDKVGTSLWLIPSYLFPWFCKPYFSVSVNWFVCTENFSEKRLVPFSHAGVTWWMLWGSPVAPRDSALEGGINFKQFVPLDFVEVWGINFKKYYLHLTINDKGELFPARDLYLLGSSDFWTQALTSSFLPFRRSGCEIHDVWRLKCSD